MPPYLGLWKVQQFDGQFLPDPSLPSTSSPEPYIKSVLRCIGRSRGVMSFWCDVLPTPSAWLPSGRLMKLQIRLFFLSFSFFGNAVVLKFCLSDAVRQSDRKRLKDYVLLSRHWILSCIAAFPKVCCAKYLLCCRWKPPGRQQEG